MQDVTYRPKNGEFSNKWKHYDTVKKGETIAIGDPTDITDDLEAYERLKLIMAEQRKFADEHMFLRQELRCREARYPGDFESVVSRIFGLLSFYGWSVTRPLKGLAFTWLAGWF